MITSNPMNLLFFGSPSFALPCLDALANSRHTIAAVYTQPDRPAGRGRKLQAPPVKIGALAHNIPVFQPERLTKDQIQAITSLQPDLIVVIAYGLILPKAMLGVPKWGCINVHASLLPRWRGAAPIQYSLLNGDPQTGITLMQMDAGMDTGDILLTRECPIYPRDTSSQLHDRLSQLAIDPLLETLDAIETGHLTPQPQNSAQATYAPKIFKNQAAICWADSAEAIDRQIRAFNPWPVAYTQAGDETLRIHQAKPIIRPLHEGNSAPLPGTILALNKTEGMVVMTGQDALQVDLIQFPGSKIMTVMDFINSGRHKRYLDLTLS
ncbi:MAG: methionyl-tRNA formyltransferase [Legionella sp.]|nr:methionyl-tRNA formyltransferase [Legionella sp.]